MQKAAYRYGLKPDEFWELTPYEVELYVGEQIKRVKLEHRENAWLAWHIVAFQRSKKLPRLEPIMQRLDPDYVAKPQTPKQMREIMMSWVAATGGKDLRKKGN